MLCNLPDAIHLEILSNCILIDQKEYSRITRGVCARLMKKVRRKKVGIFEFYTSAEFRGKIFSMIDNPSRQLILTSLSNQSILGTELFQDFPSPKFRELHLSTSDLSIQVLSLLKTIDFINTLKLIDRRSMNPNEVQLSILQGLSDLIQSSKLLVNELIIELNSFNVPNFPFFSRVQLLVLKSFPSPIDLPRISEYVHLRSLKLDYCSQVLDVSSLGHIHDLSLISCHNITDISCLNHNHTISIQYCEKILDYSKSFKYSSIIEISNNINLNFIPINMKYLESVISLKLLRHSNSFIDPLPKSLRLLHLSWDRGITSLPLNSLRQVHLVACGLFDDLKNMENIQYIELDQLFSLQRVNGLGMKNRVVKIRRCSNITDFSPLKDNLNVEISNCKGLTLTPALFKVSNFEVGLLCHPGTFQIGSLDAITDLRLIEVPADSNPLQTAILARNFSVIHHAESFPWLNFIKFLKVVFTLPKFEKLAIQFNQTKISGIEKGIVTDPLRDFLLDHGYKFEQYGGQIILLQNYSNSLYS